MTEQIETYSSRCPACGAIMDVLPETTEGTGGPGWNMRDADICKHPPIGECPQMQALLKAYAEHERGE